MTSQECAQECERLVVAGRAGMAPEIVRDIAMRHGIPLSRIDYRGRPPFEYAVILSSPVPPPVSEISHPGQRRRRLAIFVRRCHLTVTEMALVISRRERRWCSRANLSLVLHGHRSTPWIQEAVARFFGREDLFADGANGRRIATGGARTPGRAPARHAREARA